MESKGSNVAIATYCLQHEGRRFPDPTGGPGSSCSIPVMFKPMVIGGVHYIDGGVFQNLPVPTIRNMCDEVIAFSVRRMEEEKYRNNLLFAATRAYSMMFMSNIMADSRLADHFIELNTDGYSVYDLSKTPELFRQGYSDACRALEEIGYHRIRAERAERRAENGL